MSMRCEVCGTLLGREDTAYDVRFDPMIHGKEDLIMCHTCASNSVTGETR